ncbi:hypothetical protein B296_00005368 [Ensete ventricosum]|uniref:Uncharacterized protein n=1 Tax=Ensete ventricosum TaxID=4639 RepID=A0A426ZBN8_ENSVE|nr:hypothetical protein B296_00005368 [Ensete ventricosum]
METQSLLRSSPPGKNQTSNGGPQVLPLPMAGLSELNFSFSSICAQSTFKPSVIWIELQKLNAILTSRRAALVSQSSGLLVHKHRTSSVLEPRDYHMASPHRLLPIHGNVRPRQRQTYVRIHEENIQGGEEEGRSSFIGWKVNVMLHLGDSDGWYPVHITIVLATIPAQLRNAPRAPAVLLRPVVPHVP